MQATLRQVFAAVGSLDTASDYSHLLLHWEVSPDLKKERVVFASGYVARELMHVLRLESSKSSGNGLPACMETWEKASLADAAFEAIFYSTMQVGLYQGRWVPIKTVIALNTWSIA